LAAQSSEGYSEANDLREGWTLLELMVSLVVLTIGVVSFIMALTSSMKLGAAGHDRDIAVNAARQMIEQMRAYSDFSTTFAHYNANANFEVDGLTVKADDSDGYVGRIAFPTSGSELREDTSDSDLGMPKDLNGDGAIDASDHASDYIILPVTVYVEWFGSGSDWSVEVRALLVDRD